MKDDPVVNEVRRIREELAKQFHFDIDAIFADLKAKQKLVGSKLVRRTKADAAEQPAPSDHHSASLHGGR